MRGEMHDLWKKFLGVLVFGIVVTVVILLISNVSQMCRKVNDVTPEKIIRKRPHR